MNSGNPSFPLLKVYKFETVTEQRIPGTVEAANEKEARTIIEAGNAEYGDTYFAPTVIDRLEQQEVAE
jgi:hypothetical protein